MGSLKAEALLKNTYVARTGSDAGFTDYLIARLRERESSPSSSALRPTPAFSATTLECHQLSDAHGHRSRRENRLAVGERQRSHPAASRGDRTSPGIAARQAGVTIIAMW
jgi:hypothetical protein